MGTAVAKESSTANQSAWLDAAISRLWERFENRYGSLWMDRWAGLPMARVKAEWSDELRGFTAAAISYGFESIKGNRYPPTLPEFVDACRRCPRPILPALLPPTIPKEVISERLAVLGKFCKTFGKRGSITQPDDGDA